MSLLVVERRSSLSPLLTLSLCLSIMISILFKFKTPLPDGHRPRQAEPRSHRGGGHLVTPPLNRFFLSFHPATHHQRGTAVPASAPLQVFLQRPAEARRLVFRTCDIGTRPRCSRHISATQTPPRSLQPLSLADSLFTQAVFKSSDWSTGRVMEREDSSRPTTEGLQLMFWWERWLGLLLSQATCPPHRDRSLCIDRAMQDVKNRPMSPASSGACA